MTTLATVSASGLFATLPAFGIFGRVFYATDTGQIFYDSGTAWVDVSPALTALSQSHIQQQAYTYAADDGVANAYLVVLTPTPTIVAGSVVVFKAGAANTGASTLSINGGPLVPIVKDGGTALAGGEILANKIITAIFDGANFQI